MIHSYRESFIVDCSERISVCTRDEIFQYTNDYTESPEYTKSIKTSLRNLPSIPSHRPVTEKILQSTKLVRVYCGSIPISLRDLRSILNDLPKSTKCILNLRDIPNSLYSLQSIPNDLSEYTKRIRKVYYSIRFHGIFDSYIISFQPSTFPLPDL